MSSYAVQLVQQLVGQQNIITIPRAIIELVGDHVAAAVLCQLLYWHGRMGGREFFKSDAELGYEVCASPFQLRRARMRLVAFGVTTTRRGIPARLHYQLDTELLSSQLLRNLTTSDRGTQQHSTSLDYTQDYPRDLKPFVGDENSAPAYAAMSANADDQAQTERPHEGKTLPTPGTDVAMPAQGGLNPAEPLRDSAPAPSTELVTRNDTTSESGSRRLSRRGAAIDYEAMMAVYNDNCGALPRASTLTKHRRRRLAQLVAEHGDDATALLLDASRQVAHDEFWIDRGYGLDNLLRQGRVLEKAEKLRGRGGSMSVAERRMAATFGRVLGAIGGGSRHD